MLNFGNKLSICKGIVYLTWEKCNLLGTVGRDGGRGPQEGSCLDVTSNSRLSGQGGVSVTARRFWFNKTN